MQLADNNKKNSQHTRTGPPSAETQVATCPRGKSVTFILPNKEDVVDKAPHCPNTNPNVHFNNQTKCLLCGVEDTSLVSHYLTCHSTSEVYVSRPSPQMAGKLRSQTDKFTFIGNGKIVGPCFFCGDTKTMNKFDWRHHILSHTGEKNFSCNLCTMDVNYKNQHNRASDNGEFKCDGKLVDICECNSLDGSYVGFICIECNFVQVCTCAVN